MLPLFILPVVPVVFFFRPRWNGVVVVVVMIEDDLDFKRVIYSLTALTTHGKSIYDLEFYFRSGSEFICSFVKTSREEKNVCCM
jgi:hypothetical protein